MKCHPSYFYLFVHSSHDCSADLHPQHKAALEVLLQEERLQESHHKQQHCIQIPFPDEAGFVLSEGDHQPGKRKEIHVAALHGFLH